MSGRRGLPVMAAAAAGTVLLVTGGVTASAAPSRPVSTPAGVRALAQKAAAPRVAALADDDPNKLGPGGLPRDSSAVLTLGTGLSPSLRDGRARVSIDLASVTVAGYLAPNYRTPQNDNVYAPPPRSWLPKRPDPSCDYYYKTLPADLYVIDIDQPDPNQSGTIRSVGIFPTTKVSTLAFGSIPLTATLHVEQLERDGKVVPLEADERTEPKSVAKGAGFDAARGCDPTWEKFASHGTAVKGQVTARFSDVRLDGQPVDVGPNCRTASPLNLNLNGLPEELGGNYHLTDHGLLVQAADRRIQNPANPIAIAPGSSNLTIPPFVGCVGKSGENFSTVVTNTVSGPDAALGVNQSVAPINFFDPITNVTKSGVTIPPHVHAPVPGR